MSKALVGAAELAGAAVIAAGMLFPGTAAFFNNPIFYKLLTALVIGGITTEAGEIAGALTSNRGMGITTRQTAAERQVIYGQQRVGGVFIYRSTTGSSHDQFNYIIVLAGHEVDSIQNLYLDGRQVHWLGSGPGYAIRNGVGFGGVADNNSYTGPNGVQYNFGGTGHNGIYAEARYGDQTESDLMTSMMANDPNWAPDAHGNTPWVAGCCYIYLKVEYSTNLFPGEPEIRLTVNGKNTVYDPRTGTTGFTSNPALIAADIFTDPIFGLGDDSVNQAQLIAAANICDEQVTVQALVNSGTVPSTEARYATNHHYDTSTAPGDALAQIMVAMGGRWSRIGGEWYIWPAYWQGPTFQFTEASLTDTVTWNPYRKYRDLFNRVNGTYIAPTYPYNIAGNLYDKNGFYNGEAQNNFPYAWQPTNYPQYAADVLHGYAADQYLIEDGGKQLVRELSLGTVNSVTQSQRLAKIALLRNRQQGSGTMEMNLEAFGMQPVDVFQMTMSAYGWIEKQLEVTDLSWTMKDSGDGGAGSYRCNLTVQETDQSVYEWDTVEELTVVDAPANPIQTTYDPAPPTGMTLTSGAGTAVVQPDGTVQPRIEVQWDTPMDILTKNIQIQYQQVGASVWLSAPTVDVSLNLGFIGGVVAGGQYNVQIRSARANGAVSQWEQILGYTVSITLSTQGSLALSQASLVGIALPDGTADIEVDPFTAVYGSLSVAILPAGAFTIVGLDQSTLYWVYYVDAAFSGGAITPVATTNSSDFLAKTGFFLIGTIVTPSNSGGGGGGGGTRYTPSSFSDVGTRTTVSPQAAYDGNVSSDAIVSGTFTHTVGVSGTGTTGNCIWQGFPNVITTVATSLNVTASVVSSGISCVLFGNINGTSTTMLSTTSGAAETTYTLAVPIGTNLSTVSLSALVDGGDHAGASSATANIKGFEIWIQ